MALFAGDRGIMTGEELTYDYNFDPYSLKNVQECRCGEKGCRGVLGPKPKEEREKKQQKEDSTAKEGKLKGVKRKVVEVVEEGLANKKRKLGVKEVKTASRNPRASLSPKKPAKSSVKLVKKGIRRSSAPAGQGQGLQRKPSTLKRMLSDAKSRATLAKERAAGRRAVSSTSTEALLGKETKEGDADVDKDGEGKTVKVKRVKSLKAKVGSLRNSASRSVRGR